MSGLWGAVMRPFIERHFSLFLLVAFAIGLFVPDLSFIPKEIVPIILAAIIFVSCSKIKLEDFKQFRAHEVAGFVVLRFVMLPVLVFYLAQAIVPEYKYVLLMFALLPCGVTLSTMMGIVGGSAALGLTATTLTSFIAPFSIPIAFQFLSTHAIEVDTLGMFKTLVFMIVFPVVLYFGFVRRFEKVKVSMRENSSVLSCFLICMNVIIVVSYQQDKFFEHFDFLFFTLLLGAVAYVALYFLGWFFLPKGTKKQKISYALMSGNNNINLGISLAVLFMPSFEALVLVLWELSWILSLVVFQIFVRRYDRDII